MNVSDMLKTYKRWVVIGDVENEQKYANKIYNRLISNKYEVYGVYKKTGQNVFDSFDEIKGEFCIDLCINPIEGIKYVKLANKKGVKDIVLQPGAESLDIINYCKENRINCVKGCVLKELNNTK